VPFYWVLKKVHWSDTDAAGIVWFPNFFGWFEDAEEEIYVAATGHTRQWLLDQHAFAMPRVDASAKYRAPVRAGELIRVGIASTLENPRRLRHDFEMRREPDGVLLAEGLVRVACVDAATFKPQDFPAPVLELVKNLPAAAEEQRTGGGAMPWV
jgi:acyl-CoA thioester hydrolase